MTMMKTFGRTLLLVGAALFLGACGDIGRVVLDVQFPDEDTELQTRALEIIVRDATLDETPCANPFDRRVTGAAEDRVLIEYPTVVDTGVVNVNLEQYGALNLRVYAFDGFDFEVDRMVAGGCVRNNSEPGVTTTLVVPLEAL